MMKTIMLFALSLLSLPAATFDRSFGIMAPAEASPRSLVTVQVYASTDALDGEIIGFFHADYSLDGGKTWVPICNETRPGTELVRRSTIKVGRAGTKLFIRARVAFRGGKARDVDFTGAPIRWAETWDHWRAPPAKYTIIYVR